MTKRIDIGRDRDMIDMDFRKVFDKILHGSIDKVVTCGILAVLTNWIQN